MEVGKKLRRASFIVAIAGLLVSLTPAIQAEAAIVKTTVTITPPAFVFAGAPNPIDVAVCAKSSLKTTSCESGDERAATLYVNGSKVQTLTTVGGGGATTFFWTPKVTGKASLVVKVAAKGSARRAAVSDAKVVTVKPKTTATTLSTVTCGYECSDGIPDTLDLNDEQVIVLGINSKVTKGRNVHFQTLRIDNKYWDDYSETSSWQSDIGKNGLAITFADIESLADCTPGDTLTWNIRFYVDATSKSPAGATAAKWIDIVCPTGDQSGSVQLDVNYSDQSIDYAVDSPPMVHVSVTAPDSTQYSIYSEYCLKSLDCTNYDNWVWIEGYYEVDKIFGSQEFDFSADPGDYGEYWFRVEVYPWTGEDPVFSEVYTLDLW